MGVVFSGPENAAQTWKIPSSFGYDQGMMGGVNVAPDYVRTMKLGFSTCVTISHRQGIER